MFKTRPARYRSKLTGQYVSEDFAHDHPDETYSPRRFGVWPLAVGAVAGLLGAAGAVVAYRRARR
jgi:hypothetical protein